MGKLLFVTLDVTLVTIVTLSCHPDVTVFCSSFFPPTPHFLGATVPLLPPMRVFALFFFLFDQRRRKPQNEANRRNSAVAVLPSMRSSFNRSASFTAFHLPVDSFQSTSSNRSLLSPVAADIVVIVVFAAFVLQSP